MEEKDAAKSQFSLDARLCIRGFDGIASLACSAARMVQTDMNTPFVIVSVDARGQVPTFGPELLSVATADYVDFSFRNVLEDSLEALAATMKFRRVAAEIRLGWSNAAEAASTLGSVAAAATSA